MAVTSLVCGLAQFLLWFPFVIPGIVLAILALIFGLVGMAQIRHRGEAGNGMAIAGLALGVVGVAFWAILGILVAVGTTNYHWGNY